MLFLATATTSAAQPPAPPPPSAADSRVLTYPEALERARVWSPVRSSRALQLDVVAAERRQAGARPNPELGLELENFSGSLPGFRESETTVFLSQPFEAGGKRGARRRLADAGEPLARAGMDEFERLLARDVALAFAAGLAAQERLVLRRELLTLADDVVRTAEQKVALGAVLRAEATRSRVTRNLAAIEFEAAERELALSRQTLARLFGGTAEDVAGFSGTLDTLRVVPGPAEIDSLLADHPTLRRLRAESGLAEAELGLQESLSSQDFRLGAGFRLLDGTDEGTFLIGVSATLPVSDRNDGSIAAARVAIEQAALAERAGRHELATRAEQALGELVIAQAAVRGLRRDVLPTARQSYTEVETAYHQGRLTYLDLLDARRSLAEARLTEIDWLAELYSLRAELEWTFGRELPAVWEGSR
jgi:cobalt-zinc-cadmium efflux system outer membrane protein